MKLRVSLLSHSSFSDIHSVRFLATVLNRKSSLSGLKVPCGRLERLAETRLLVEAELGREPVQCPAKSLEQFVSLERVNEKSRGVDDWVSWRTSRFGRASIRNRRVELQV